MLRELILSDLDFFAAADYSRELVLRGMDFFWRPFCDLSLFASRAYVKRHGFFLADPRPQLYYSRELILRGIDFFLRPLRGLSLLAARANVKRNGFFQCDLCRQIIFHILGLKF